MRRRLLIPLALVALAAILYLLVFRGESIAPRLTPTRATSVIGSGSSAVGVSADGAILSWLPPPADGSLPRLPLSTPPEPPRLRGTLLEQARVLGAAPAALRPYLESSYYGESGVDVELTSGVELRFGAAAQAARKWRAAAAVLAEPSVTTLDYVDLHAPSRPSVGGSGHTLPPIP